jgi:uncharacterized membrane protein
MELNRHHYLGIGMVLLLLGLQLRYVDSFQLNEATTKALAKRMKKEATVMHSPLAAIFGQAHPEAVKTVVRPPKWIGWSLVSIGGVLVFQSLGMRKPGS